MLKVYQLSSLRRYTVQLQQSVINDLGVRVTCALVAGFQEHLGEVLRQDKVILGLQALENQLELVYPEKVFSKLSRLQVKSPQKYPTQQNVHTFLLLFLNHS